MNKVEISIIRSWLQNKKIEEIAKEHKLNQTQVSEILDKIAYRFDTVESTVKLLEEVGITEEIIKNNLRKIPKTYKTDEYDF